MDFLKNIATGVYNTLNPIVNKVASVFKPTSVSAQSTVVPQMSYDPSLNTSGMSVDSSIPQSSSAPQQTYLPTTNLPQMSMDPSLNQSGMSVSPDFLYLGNARPSSIGQIDAYGRKSTPQKGSAYQELVGDEYRTVIPQVGYDGMSGGTSGQSFASFAPTGTQGTTGAGGFGSVSSGNAIGTNAIASQTADEEIKKREAEALKKAKALSVLSPGLGLMAANGVQQKSLTEQGGGLTQPNAGVDVNVPTGGTFNVSNLDTQKAAISKLINNPASLSNDDIGALNQSLDSLFSIARQVQDSQNPTPENIVVDTPEQQAYIESSSDPFGAKQLIDEVKAQNGRMTEYETARYDLIKNIQSANAAYAPILEDIKTNPNLPKALAGRRLEEIQKKQKVLVDKYTNELELVNQSIADINRSVNSKLGIIQMAENKAERERDNAVQKLKLSVDMGTLAVASDAELAKYAAQTGMSIAELKSARTANKSAGTKTELVGSASTGYSLITYKDGEIVSTKQAIAPSQTTSGPSVYTTKLQANINTGMAPSDAVDSVAAYYEQVMGVPMDTAMLDRLFKEVSVMKPQAQPAPTPVAPAPTRSTSTPLTSMNPVAKNDPLAGLGFNNMNLSAGLSKNVTDSLFSKLWGQGF